MPPTLADLFQVANGGPIDLAGRAVHMTHVIDGVTTPTQLSITFQKVSNERQQAVRLRAKGGVIDVQQQRLDDVVLWSDTAPRHVEVWLSPSRNKPMTVRLWNAWRDPSGAMQAWLGNAGIVIEESGIDRWILRCSDGYDDPTFDDLVVEIELVARNG